MSFVLVGAALGAIVASNSAFANGTDTGYRAAYPASDESVAADNATTPLFMASPVENYSTPAFTAVRRAAPAVTFQDPHWGPADDATDD
ncbi:hypothetical protein V5F77_19225 [Xanthobacter sp. DSM 24535]|uniref:hypothetical protein n=1 Tax=Roseixanthobacter psychrophilus TaxID=3119917 RepID=UPI0037282288